jgi:hypothetical protein
VSMTFYLHSGFFFARFSLFIRTKSKVANSQVFCPGLIGKLGLDKNVVFYENF